MKKWVIHTLFMSIILGFCQKIHTFSLPTSIGGFWGPDESFARPIGLHPGDPPISATATGTPPTSSGMAAVPSSTATTTQKMVRLVNYLSAGAAQPVPKLGARNLLNQS
jgi:hypothetical protein